MITIKYWTSWVGSKSLKNAIIKGTANIMVDPLTFEEFITNIDLNELPYYLAIEKLIRRERFIHGYDYHRSVRDYGVPVFSDDTAARFNSIWGWCDLMSAIWSIPGRHLSPFLFVKEVSVKNNVLPLFLPQSKPLF